MTGRYSTHVGLNTVIIGAKGWCRIGEHAAVSHEIRGLPDEQDL